MGEEEKAKKKRKKKHNNNNDDMSKCRRNKKREIVGCLTSQQHASVSQGRICSDNFTCCHTEMEVADPTFHLTQSQYTDTGPNSPSTDSITSGVWQGIATGVPISKSLV